MENIPKNRIETDQQIQGLIDRIGFKKFNAFFNSAYSILIAMKPGDVFRVEEKIRQENKRAFMLVVCLYIIETGRNCNVDIANDWKSVKGVQTMNSYLLELTRINQHNEKIRQYEKAE